MLRNGEIFAGLVLHMFLLAAPAVAAALVAVRRRLDNVPLIIGIALAASGILAFCSFWAYYADPTIGQIWDFLLIFGSVEVAAWTVWRGQLDRAVLRALATPLALWVLGIFFVAYFGFLHGGSGDAIPMSSTRFSGQLPSDNDIPRFFSEWFAAQGGDGRPPIYPPDWLMSDRPPLQIGYVLSHQAIVDSRGGSSYELLCIGVQALWIPAMWAVLVAAQLRPATRSLAMLAAMISDVAILHGFFVWPKLIAAAFLLAALALLVSPEWPRWRRDWRIGALLGALLALALLSHGSALFGLFPLVAIALYRGGLPAWRWAGVLILIGAVLYVPWMAYQRYADPPSNRLLKYQLAGYVEIDNRGTLETIVDSYESVGLDGAIDNKLDNFGEMLGVDSVTKVTDTSIGGLAGDQSWFDAAEALVEGRFYGVVNGIRGPRFFSLLPFLGLLLVGPIAMVVARARHRAREDVEWKFALLCFAFAAIACVIWGLLLFGNPWSRTTLHVGSLAVPLLCVIGCVVGLRSVYPRLALGVVVANVAIVLLTYGPAVTPWPETSYSPAAAVMTVLSLAGICWVLREAWPRSVGSRPG